MHQKCIRDKKRFKRRQDIQRILEDLTKGVRNIPGIKSAKKKVLVTKIKNEKGEIITSRKGIANVCGEFDKTIFTTTMSKMKLNKKSEKMKMKATLTCTTKTPTR